MPPAASHDGFLLLKAWRDSPEGLTLELWVATDELPLCVTIAGQEAVMFIEHDKQARCLRRQPIPLKSLAGKAVDALYFGKQRELQDERQRLRQAGVLPFEADIKPVDRFLMERFVTGGIRVSGSSAVRGGVRYLKNPRITNCDFTPNLKLLSLDIETDGFEGPLLSIAGICDGEERVFLVKQGGTRPRQLEAHIIPCVSEAAALSAFSKWVQSLDPDILIGWNVVDFDLDYLNKLALRLKQPLALGRGGSKAELLKSRPASQGMRATGTVARIPGRMVLDGISTLRNATMHFQSYALDDVAEQLLGRGKQIDKTHNAAAEISRMAREAPEALARYNLEDCRLVLDIFAKARLIDFAVERQQLTGLLMDRQGGSVAAFDQLYLPRLHRAGFVAPSVGDREELQGSPGGYVMDSVPGLFRNVIVLDFKSLYPSIIRTFLVDPLGLAQPGLDPVPGYDGALFARDGHILPELIVSLWAARDQAKSEKNAAMSQAIKIMMNSFYGVLGTPGCRFFDHRLVSSITKRGHEIIQRSRDFIEERGLQVIYGDTDSVFVRLAPELEDHACDKIGRELAQDLTAHFRNSLQRENRIESHLELEYETHFRRFLMPTMRGSEVGTKKRYAGSIINPQGEMEVVFKGLEAIRTDWTPLARNFQKELFQRVFSDQAYELFVRQTADALLSGKLDEQLVYRKRIRRHLDDYIKNVPPHVQAARKLPIPSGRHVEYLITKNGPEPLGYVRSPIDYEHYLHRQLEPAAQSILHFLNKDFTQIAGKQLGLFA